MTWPTKTTKTFTTSDSKCSGSPRPTFTIIVDEAVLHKMSSLKLPEPSYFWSSMASYPTTFIPSTSSPRLDVYPQHLCQFKSSTVFSPLRILCKYDTLVVFNNAHFHLRHAKSYTRCLRRQTANFLAERRLLGSLLSLWHFAKHNRTFKGVFTMIKTFP